MKAHNISNIIKRSWWLILALMLITSGIGLYLSHTQTRTFQAKSTFVVDPISGDAQANISRINTLNRDSKVVTTFCGILSSSDTFNQALAFVDVPLDAASGYSTSCLVQPNSNVLDVKVTGPSAVLAAHLANAIGDVSKTGQNSLQSEYTINNLSVAKVNNRAISPDHLVNTVMAALVGLFAGLMLIFLGSFLTQPTAVTPVPVTAQPMPAVSTNSSNSRSIYPISR